jgi:hypothetical protein
MQATLLSPDERTVIDALAAEGERTLPADLDPAVHSLEQRGWISLMSRGAVIDGEREYMLDLKPHGRVIAGRSRPRESRPARGRAADTHARRGERAIRTQPSKTRSHAA